MEKRCLRCGNTDGYYFYHDQGVLYCRKCVNFKRLDVGDYPVKVEYKKRKIRCDYHLKYPLTIEQKRCQKEIAMYLSKRQDVLVYAACGAGKTEIVMDSIKRYLNEGKKVGFAISRRQVVLEIQTRMQEAFSSLQVVAVCEGYTEITDGDLIICTMHQLYRYYQTFDLLIMDEVDAFPYRGNVMLENIAKDACIGQFIYLSATPDETMLEAIQKQELGLVELFQRPHGYPLIVPEVYCGFHWYLYIRLYEFLKHHMRCLKQVLLFVPTIALAHRLKNILSVFFRCIDITSKSEDKDQIIQAFHEHTYDVLISTTILERGITIKDIQVVILFADHMVFHEASLIQIIGRVGRNMEKPTGEGMFLCRKKTADIKHCIYAIQRMNGDVI